MKLTWEERGGHIGSWVLTVTTENGEEAWVNVRDFTCPFMQEEFKRAPLLKKEHPYDFTVSFCMGCSETLTFMAPEYNWEKVKIAAEDFLLDMFIERYNKVLRDLPSLKKDAEQAINIKEARNANSK